MLAAAPNAARYRGRRFDAPRLVAATHNHDKLVEIRGFLGGRVSEPHRLAIVSAGELGLDEPEESGDSFSANAMIKARTAAQTANEIALADDSGLSVTALGGEPGIRSARWAPKNAAGEKDFEAAMQHVHERMADAPDRSACFICALALAWPDGHCETVVGRIDGAIVWPPRGDAGFGYDPFFVPAGSNRTFAEMSPLKKQRISHRAQAFRKLIERCFWE
ncbi:MAG: RdgB/HAM1 family non-canonical purine NTP pyrophosphatase [Alphaproteobacteria bacterium]|nr:RdgB/HAM1 family non-canonical purine NTP pyrophosphatase [Alphaproteobacteria bacterium]